MSPEQVSLINTVAFIIDRIGTWPIGTLGFLVIAGPWVMQYFIARELSKRYEEDKEARDKQFSAVTRMYENNVELVKDYGKIADNLQELVIMNTKAMTDMLFIAKHNLICPVLRSTFKHKIPDASDGAKDGGKT